jgi:hypothetical protein
MKPIAVMSSQEGWSRSADTYVDPTLDSCHKQYITLKIIHKPLNGQIVTVNISTDIDH